MKIIAVDGLSAPAKELLSKSSKAQCEVLGQATKEEKFQKIKDADAIIIRSATKADKELLENAPKLKLIVRAGIGLDNVDVIEATKRGVIVMNTPAGNMVTTAEHTIAMMMSVVRSIPQATASMKAGKWEKGKFQGRELKNKTLGVLGLGNIGKVVARLAQGLGMKVVGYDPFVSDEVARQMDVEKVPLDQLYGRADLLTVHVPLTDETKHLINRESFQKMKKGVYIIHCARGGIVEEKALLDALEEGRVAGAALDVFEQEPPPADHILIKHPKVICTPHVGASTDEAQLAVSLEAAEQIVDYIERGEIRNAVNHPNISTQKYKLVEPYMTLTERMGRFLGLWVYGKPVEEISIIYRGVFSDADRPLVTLGLIKGFLSPSFAEKVNFVNARSLAQQAEIRVLESSGQASPHFTCLVEARVKAKDQEPVVLSGALFGNVDYRFVEFEGFRLDGHPTGWVLITINQDIPNMVGQIGSLLGKHGVNIASMHLGRRDRDRLACAMTNVDSEVPAKVLEELRSISGVTFAKQFHIPGTSS